MGTFTRRSASKRRMRRFSLLVFEVALLIPLGASGCSLGASSASSGPEPTPEKLATFRAHQGEGYVLRFKYPASWHHYDWFVVSTFSFSMAHVSTGVQPNACQPIPKGTSCSYPRQLEPSGVAVSWTVWSSFVGSFADHPGKLQHLPSGLWEKVSIAKPSADDLPAGIRADER